MKIRFLDIAQDELDETIDYYNYEPPGLGNEFLTEILNTLDRIAQFPKAWHPISKEREGVKHVDFLMVLFTRR